MSNFNMNDRIAEAKYNIDTRLGTANLKKVILATIAVVAVPAIAIKFLIPFVVKTFNLDNSVLTNIVFLFAFIAIINKSLYLSNINKLLLMEASDDDISPTSDLLIPLKLDIKVNNIFKYELDYEVSGIQETLAKISILLNLILTILTIGTIAYEGIVLGFTMATTIVQLAHVLIVALYIALNLARMTLVAATRADFGDYFETTRDKILFYILMITNVAFTLYFIAMLVTSFMGINMTQPILNVGLLILSVIVFPIWSYFNFNKIFKMYRQQEIEKAILDRVL